MSSENGNAPEHLRSRIAAMHGARLTGEARTRMRELCVGWVETGVPFIEAYATAKRDHGLLMGEKAFERGYWEWALLEIRRRKRTYEPPSEQRFLPDPGENAGPASAAKQTAAQAVVSGAVEGEASPGRGDVTITSQLGTFVLRPRAGGGVDVELRARMDRSTGLSLLGQAYAILCPEAAQ